ncbi:MAG: LuxR family transcriptional regulator, partial [Chloroflexaceae bacterium]|nr:LuxR family transcriptional regulator [Chloroflexaceae bacterium]
MQQLLTTKMRVPPAHPALVPRPRLAALLRQGLAGPVTLLVAPAGFGKTTLLASSLTHMQGEERTDHTPSSAFSLQPSAFAWLSLEPADNESSRFWHYLLMALELARPGSAAPALALVQGPPPPPAEALLGALLNSLAELPAPLVLVLDDYHVIENPAIHQGMVFLLEHQPPNLRLVLASRSQPPLPLARLRARGQLLEVDADALRFQSTETAAFLQGRMGLNLPPAVVAALEGRTEGWAAGLQLAALSLRGRTDAEAFVTAFTGSNRYILDYLVDEVLALQPEETQQFLLATSILARLCGPLCAALLAKETTEADAHAAQQMLTHLERSNLFLVPLDGDGQWYRYHQLFAEALQARLRQTQLALLPQLHGRAARWFLAQEAWGESVQHAQASGDVALLAEVLEDASGPLLMGGQAHQL